MRLLRLLFDGRGRIGRTGYFAGLLVLALTGAAAAGVYYALPATTRAPPFGPAYALLGLFWFLAAFCGWLALSCKRLRDMDQSPWWTGLIFMPFVGFGAVTMFLLLLPGTDGPNRYGPSPQSA